MSSLLYDVVVIVYRYKYKLIKWEAHLCLNQLNIKSMKMYQLGK